MRITEQQKSDRAKQIHKAITQLQKSKSPITVNAVVELTGLSKDAVYKSEEVRQFLSTDNRGEVIAAAIQKLQRKGLPATVKDLVELTGLTRSVIYSHPTVKEFLAPLPKETIKGVVVTNRNYKAIIKSGFSLEISDTRPTSTILNAKRGKKHIQIEYKPNGKNTTQLTEYLPNARINTSADIAMAEALHLINSEKG